jgi:[ribosomal protein S5]-alanine N-acetyltransferase
MKPPATFEMARLRLRPAVLDDASIMFATWARDPEVSRYVTWPPHRSVDDRRDFLRYGADGRAKSGPFNWAIVLREDHRLIGTVELRPQSHRVELGYVLARAYWGRGLMSEAVRVLVDWALDQPDIHRVWAVCDADNPASARVLEKAGLEREGKLRRWAMVNASALPHDAWGYARVKETP